MRRETFQILMRNSNETETVGPRKMVDEKQESWAVQVGGRISAWTSNLFAHPYMQIFVVLFCIAWFQIGLQVDLLTAALSILAITLTQMVLNRQNDREAEDRRRDIAMHAKLDELVIAMRGARDEMAGIEELEEDEIQDLKEQAAAEIDAAGQAAGAPSERAAAKKAVEVAAKKVVKKKVKKVKPLKHRGRLATSRKARRA
jgi:low affinity Fe/Cu permease